MIAGILSTLGIIVLIILLVGAIAGVAGYSRIREWMDRNRRR